MRVPLRWLREVSGVDASAAEIGERLTRSGTNLEALHTFGGAASGIVAARIEVVEAIPEARKPMWRVEADAGPSGRFEVVAGAEVSAGEVVAFAPPGARVATLPTPLEVRTMLGRYPSQGMLCAEDELGVSDDHTAIVRVEVAPGDDLVEKFALRDEVLELEITANRPDLLSIYGVAREVCVLFGTPLPPLDTTVTEDGPEVDGLTRVDIEDPEGCPRYLARIVDGVAFGPSPLWVQARLAAMDVRSLGNLVDATNYVLELTGQPLHAFDMDRLNEGRIVVRRAQNGESLTTLDGLERKLDAADLVIADARDAQALAGVMGGAQSEVGPSTSRVLIESAYFEPKTIYRTARRHGMRTGASQRFEKGTDPEGVAPAASMCAELMRLWAGGSVAKGEADRGSAPPRPVIDLRSSRTALVCGFEVERSEAERVLAGLGCEVSNGEPMKVTVPSWRPDLEREIDLIEELARIHGFEAVPSRVPTGSAGYLTRHQMLRRRLRDVLLGAGLSEATLSTFVPEDDLNLAGQGNGFVELANPMATDQRTLRPALVPNLLRAAQRNASRGLRDVALFEVGTVFTGWEPHEDLPTEREAAGFVMAGSAPGAGWHTPARPVDVFDAKGIVERVLSELGVTGWHIDVADVPAWAHPGRAGRIVAGGELLGVFGEVRPSVRRELDLVHGAAAGELYVAAMFARTPDRISIFEIPHQPPVLRDLAVVVDEDVAAGRVAEVVSGAGGPRLESLTLLDVYRGDPVPAGRKSLAYRLVFRAPDRTLRAEEADEARDAAVEAVRTELGGDVR